MLLDDAGSTMVSGCYMVKRRHGIPKMDKQASVEAGTSLCTMRIQQLSFVWVLTRLKRTQPISSHQHA
jgi:hypothetical protein